LDLAQDIIRLTESKSKIVFRPKLPEGDMTRRQPDITLMRQILDRPLTSLQSGLEKTIAAFRGM
jgi:UDP-glucose 4-epimerase